MALASIVGAFVLLTFIVETIILAGKDWKVSRSTPVYLLAYNSLSHYQREYASFCYLFWRTLGCYMIGGVAAVVASLFLVAPLSFFVVGPFPMTGYGILLSGVLAFEVLSIVTLSILFLLIFTINWVVEKASTTSFPTMSNTYTRGISNWYNQKKDKFCPIITNEDE